VARRRRPQDGRRPSGPRSQPCGGCELSDLVDDQPLFDELLHAAARLGVAVRIEPFATPATMGGGLYVVRGESLILIDQRAPLPDRLRAVARALVELQSETVYMAPEAREFIEAVRGVLQTTGLLDHRTRMTPHTTGAGATTTAGAGATTTGRGATTTRAGAT
jgi:hypothetical protein